MGFGVDEQLDSCPHWPTGLTFPVNTRTLTGGRGGFLLIGVLQQLRERSRWFLLCRCAHWWGCIYSSVFLSCLDTGEDQWHFSVVWAKDHLLHLSDDTLECFILTSCKIIELILMHVLSSLLFIYGMDFNPYICTSPSCYTCKEICPSYKEWIVQLNALGSVRFVLGNSRLKTQIFEKFDATLYHSFSSGCSLTVIKAQVDSMWHSQSMDPLAPAYSTYGTSKVMQLL